MARAPSLLTFLKQNWLIVGMLSVACIAVLWFGGSMVRDIVYFNDPANQDKDLRGWMTPRYIVMSYDLPRSVVADVLELSSIDQRRILLRDVADEMGVTMDELTDMVRATAAEHRATGQ